MYGTIQYIAYLSMVLIACERWINIMGQSNSVSDKEYSLPIKSEISDF